MPASQAGDKHRKTNKHSEDSGKRKVAVLDSAHAQQCHYLPDGGGMQRWASRSYEPPASRQRSISSSSCNCGTTIAATMPSNNGTRTTAHTKRTSVLKSRLIDAIAWLPNVEFSGRRRRSAGTIGYAQPKARRHLGCAPRTIHKARASAQAALGGSSVLCRDFLRRTENPAATGRLCGKRRGATPGGTQLCGLPPRATPRPDPACGASASSSRHPHLARATLRSSLRTPPHPQAQRTEKRDA